MAEKLKVKFLTALWGARYIDEFSRISLPSYLAPGNLPYLAAEADLEILIMTSADSTAILDVSPIFIRLKSLCPVRYLYIDDLITTGNYGVTLTLAYARGVRDSGPEQTNTHFVFMNSDFVLADGALRTLVAKLRDGHRCVMAPSLRVCLEGVQHQLADAADASRDAIVVKPRDLVRLALDNLHPTVIAKTVTQDFVTCTTHNQIYWPCDDTTLLVRHFLVFMLAIKPEQPLESINSYCDYGFVPEMVPSGEFIVLDDSDDFTMLELQPASQERQMLQCGRATVREIADELSKWTTGEHRRFAEHDIVFHSGDLPASLPAARQGLSDFVAAVRRHMSGPPQSHVDHFYWYFGIRAWAVLRSASHPDGKTFPPELSALKPAPRPPRPVPPQTPQASPPPAAAPPASPRRERIRPLHELRRALHESRLALQRLRSKIAYGYVGLVGWVRIFAGTDPNVAIWHHRWLDCRLVLHWLERLRQQQGKRNLLVCCQGSPLRTSIGHLPSFDIMLIGDGFGRRPALFRRDGSTASGAYDNVFVHLYEDNFKRSRAILSKVERFAKTDGLIAVLMQYSNEDLNHGGLSAELAQNVSDILPPDWLGFRLTASFSGGAVKRKLRAWERRLFRYLWPSSLWKLPHLVGAVCLWPTVAALTAANNIRLRNGFETCPEFCSAVLLTLQRKPLA